MSLPRENVVFKLDADLHAKLKAICDARGLTQAEFCESVIIPAIQRVLHEHMVLSRKLNESGIAVNGDELQSTPVNDLLERTGRFKALK
jgi:hypothetical protein